MEKQNVADDRCHQCKAHDASELELNEGPGAGAGVNYSFKGMLCGVHAAEMKDHFEVLKRKRTGQ